MENYECRKPCNPIGSHMTVSDVRRMVDWCKVPSLSGCIPLVTPCPLTMARWSYWQHSQRPFSSQASQNAVQFKRVPLRTTNMMLEALSCMRLCVMLCLHPVARQRAAVPNGASNEDYSKIANCCNYPSFHFTCLFPDKFVSWHLATSQWTKIPEDLTMSTSQFHVYLPCFALLTRRRP